MTETENCLHIISWLFRYIEDNGTYDSTREKNLTLNHVAYEILKILEENGESVDVTFHITLDENGEYALIPLTLP